MVNAPLPAYSRARRSAAWGGAVSFGQQVSEKDHQNNHNS